MRVMEDTDWFKLGVPLERISDLLQALSTVRECAQI